MVQMSQQEWSLVLRMGCNEGGFWSLSWQALWVLCLTAVIATLGGQNPRFPFQQNKL